MKRILLLTIAALALAAAPVRAESIVLTIDRATLLNFTKAATPYSFEVGKPGLSETLSLSNPREMKFENGKIRLRVDCTGEPIPFFAELVPTVSLAFDRQKNAFVATVDSLPVKIGPLGTIDLKKYIDPIEIPVTFAAPVDAVAPGLVVDTLIRDLKVLEDRIEARADLIFHRGEGATAAARR